MPGPAPNPQARRRNVRPDWRTLPAAGRPGRAPAWPMGKANRQQSALWRSLWSTPQAVAWEELGWTRVVARYAQVLLVCESPECTAAMLAEARQLEDRLGLSPMAMKRLQWEVETRPRESNGGDAKVTNIDRFRNL
ncbi:phage terminase small subunit [Rhodococcus rhodochrous]|uniref:phage terminase small subunit n=1 Tax=Rhodococcus rhodochrous TaxID=1829 RepID=UPI003FD76798